MSSLFTYLGWLFAAWRSLSSPHELALENLALRQQLAVLQRQTPPIVADHGQALLGGARALRHLEAFELICGLETIADTPTSDLSLSAIGGSA